MQRRGGIRPVEAEVSGAKRRQGGALCAEVGEARPAPPAAYFHDFVYGTNARAVLRRISEASPGPTWALHEP